MGRLLLFIFLLGLLSTPAVAVEFDEHVGRLPLGHHLQVFEDPSGKADITEVSALPDERFTANERPVLNAGYSRSAFWLRLDLTYRPEVADSARRWLLELAYPPLDDIQLFVPADEGGYRLAWRTGDTHPFDSRQFRQADYLFALDLQPAQPQRVYLRVQSQGSVQVPLTLWTENAYLEQQPGRIYVLGLIYGVLLVMLVYNLFVYLSIRDISYLYYIAYIAAFGLYQVSVNGAGVQYFWPDNPHWANLATPLLIGAAGLFGCQFTRSFLQTDRHSPWIDRLLILMMAMAAVVMALAVWVDYSLSLRAATLLALLFTLVVFAAGIAAWVRGMRMARYFVIAWSALLVGGQINTLMVLGYLPHSFFTMYASQIGSAIEVALLSLALADRINTLRDERTAILEATGAELASLNRQLAESNRLKDEFLSTVSHELRTPMMGVTGALQLLPEADSAEEREQFQGIAEGSAATMLGMIDDLLLLCELRANRASPRPTVFSLRALGDGLRQRFEGLAQAKGLILRVECDARLDETLVGDEERIRQCLTRLLDNAIKFTDHGGVTLRLVCLAEQGEALSVRLEVIDSGIGFAAAEGDGLVYEHFRQLDGSLTRRHGGLGIGLAISSLLARVLGGQLEHRSSPGAGSCFALSLSLPRSAVACGAERCNERVA
ncbi:sensor histidine kinase [Stutzerimonas balearica]|jgi:Signal transduction histidine kinase|uniref:sensor histidine kinase n=1 Tax=Stutzerimonas balearica TaxID=74829 RepID=UPI0022AF5EA4|nr:hybrid sensor histidine kinase/response regulator [Stutzerimonas balearica]MCZ4129074.1 ATP-binding protein [Stutzerimonas balearica]